MSKTDPTLTGIFDLFKDKAEKVLSEIEDIAGDLGTPDESKAGVSRRERVRKARERAAKRRESTESGMDFDRYLKEHEAMDVNRFNHIQLERLQMRFAEEREELKERYDQQIDQLEDQIKALEDQADEQQLLLAQRQAERIKQLVEQAKAGQKIHI